MRTSDVIEIVAAALIVAWVWRHVWIDDRAREDVADDDVWHAGAELLRRAREKMQDRRP